jgi:RNA polymerase sigma factor (sigma-70 family)
VNEVPEWLRVRLGRDVVEQDIRFAVVKAAHDFDPVKYPGVPFAAFAFNGVRLHMRSFARQLGRPETWWTMPASREDGASMEGEIPDHRDPVPDRLLRAWCDEDYARQRRCLDWRARLVLYLRTVEGMTLDETGECMGVTRERVRQLEDRATWQLARFRVRRARERGLQPTTEG